MSWATKYKGEFKDNQGNDWDVEFQFDGYSGSTYNIKLGGEPLVIQKNVNNEQFSHIATKTAIISIECKQHFRFLELYSSGNLYCRVYITKNSNLYFLGYVMNDYQEPYDDLPYFVQVKATDALPYLKELAYDDNGTPYNGHKRISKIVLDILGKIGYTSFTEFINLYERYMNQNTEDSMFDQTLINVDVFAGKDCYYVLSEILKILNAALVQSFGVMTFYRPAELINETVYGRTFTGETTKTTTYITPEVFIDRADLDSNLHSTDGGVLTFEQPAKNIKVNFNYGNRESWIDNYDMPASSWDADNKTLDYWTISGDSSKVKHISELVSEEENGIAFYSAISPITKISQNFAYMTRPNYGNEYVVFEFEYGYYNNTGSAKSNNKCQIEIKTSTGYYLRVKDSENYEWVTSAAFISTDYETANIGWSGWKKFRRKIPLIHGASSMTITLNVFAINGVYHCYRNLKIYATSYKIAYRKGVRSFWQRIEATPGDAVINLRLKNKYYDIKYKEEAENIAEKTIEKTNSIEGRKIEIDTILGDITDSGLYNIIEQFKGQLVRNQTLADVAEKFVVNHDSDYLAEDVIITQGTGTETDTIYFTSAVPGQDFSGSTTIVNVSGNLTGTPSTVQANVPATPEVAQLEISGSSGSGEITCNGVTRTMTFDTDIATTINNFITAYYWDYLAAGVLLTASTNNVVFTTYPAAEFTEQPSFSNISGDLAGDYTHLQDYAAGTARIDKIVLSGSSGSANITCNTVTKLAYFSYPETESWNDRYDPTTYKEINEYLADELKTQYALPAQKIMNLPILVREGEGYQYRHLNCWLDILNVDEQFTPIKNISAWSTYNCTLTLNEENSLLYVRKTSSGSDPWIYRDTSFSGLKYRWLIIKYRVNSNVPEYGWGRTIFYKTAGHDYHASYYKTLDEFTSDGQWHLCIADMWNLTSGGTDWKDNTITGIRIDLAPQDNIIDLEFVGFPRKFVALREEFNVRECLANIDLIEIGTANKVEKLWEKLKKHAIIRNLEKDNTLGSSSETPIYLLEYSSDGDGYYYIVRNMPYLYSLVDEPSAWALWSLSANGQPDTAAMRVTKVSYLGTYNSYPNCCKIWTGSNQISGVSTGHQMALVRPKSKFIYLKDSIDFPRNTGNWNATFTVKAAGFFIRRSDKKFCTIVSGYNSASSIPKVKHHLFSANHPLDSWTDETGASNGCMFAGNYPSGYYGLNTITQCVPLPDKDGYYASGTGFVKSDGSLDRGIIVYNDTFSDVTYYVLNIGATPEIGWVFLTSSLIYWDGKWFFDIHDGTGNTGKRKVLVSDTINGTYKYHSTIFDFSQLSDRSMLKNAVGAGDFQVIEGELFYISSGEGYSQYSGNANNHECFLWWYDKEKNVWVPSGHPFMAAKHGTGFGFTWGYDHAGQISKLFKLNDRFYFALALSTGTNTYQATCGYIEIEDFKKCKY